MTTKNFVVSFVNSDAGSEAVLVGYNLKIMEIMMIIDTCPDYKTAHENKQNYIFQYLTNNTMFIENVIYAYGIEEALSNYNIKYGIDNIINTHSNTTITIKLATSVIEKIVCIYEVGDIREPDDLKVKIEN